MAKRICVIRQSDYPRELSVRREVETLQRAGYETYVLACFESRDNTDLKREEIINGVHVYRTPLIRKKTNIVRYLYDYFVFFLWAAFKVVILHRRHPFDAIQVNTMPDFLVFASIVPKLLGAKVVVMMHEPVPELWQTLYNSPPPRMLKWAEQAALAYANAAFTVTQQLKDVYVNRGADPQKISVILNVPETRFLDEACRDVPVNSYQESDSTHFTLICHGAIEERYGHDTMLEAVALLSPKIPNLRLRILGMGSYVDQFMVLRNHLGLENCVEYLGWVPLAQMVQELNAAHVGIVAQKSSPYSNLVHTNKMYEYIALGKPVLASRLNAVAAYFGEQAVCYFEPGNPVSLAEAILDLYEHPIKRQSLVQNAQQLFNQYKWEQQKGIYLSVYQKILA
jgi:glycosyltransferase involved in cell wall biosynthesis